MLASREQTKRSVSTLKKSTNDRFTNDHEGCSGTRGHVLGERLSPPILLTAELEADSGSSLM